MSNYTVTVINSSRRDELDQTTYPTLDTDVSPNPVYTSATDDDALHEAFDNLEINQSEQAKELRDPNGDVIESTYFPAKAV